MKEDATIPWFCKVGGTSAQLKEGALSIAHTLPTAYFERFDENEDRLFYVYPRLTAHIDAMAIAAVGELFLEMIPKHAVVLDLMSSYHSHVPADLPLERLVGLGLNAEELQQNQQLSEALVHDLNRQPTLPFADASFDAAVCTVSVQYLTHPVEVFAEVGRVLRPGAPFIVSFSNRCFPSKAVRIWVATDDAQHLQLVQLYFTFAGCFHAIKGADRSLRHWLGDPLFAVVGWKLPVGGLPSMPCYNAAEP